MSKVNQDMLDIASYRLSNPMCGRCLLDHRLHIPKPSDKRLNELGIFSWEEFVRQYAKTKGWYEVLSERFPICPNCILDTDEIIEEISDYYKEVIKNYKEYMSKYFDL